MKKINWRYAFGEVLIVIIGITIAFGINKSADLRKDNQLKKQYLLNIVKDLEEDKEELDSIIKKLDDKIAVIGGITPGLLTDTDTENKIAQNLYKISTVIDFNPNNITYLSLINSGDMKLINDFELKKTIEKHYSSTYKILSKDYERQEAISRKYLADYFIDHLDFDRLKTGNSPFENKKRLKRILNSIYGTCLIKKQSSEEAIKSCENLISMLQ